MTGTVVILHQGKVSTQLLHWVRTLPSDVGLSTPEGNDIPRGRNLGVHAGLNGEWVLFIDSDSVPRADTLPTLLSRGVDLLGGVVCKRRPPWDLAAVQAGWTGGHDIKRVSLLTLPRTGIIPVSTVGTGCMLVRRAAFEAVRFPWFKCGQIRPDLLLEDSGFCLDAAKAGVQPYLDCEVRVGHDFGGGVVWPGRDGLPWIEWDGGAVTEHAPKQTDVAVA